MSNTIYLLSFLGKYDLTFQATGCPNENPTPAQIAWWKKQNDYKVFSDMLQYCVLVRDGKASPRQILECCGEDGACKSISCKKQTAWVLTTGIIAFVS